MGTIWNRVERELSRRERSASWLAQELSKQEERDYSLQRVHNWSKRDIPATEHRAVARVLGWSIERLLDDLAASSLAGPEAPNPPISDSELAMLENFRELPHDEQERRRVDLAEKAKYFRALKDEFLKRAGINVNPDVRAGQNLPVAPRHPASYDREQLRNKDSAFGELHEEPKSRRGGK